jgi:type II secretory pathway pseudopilin PulG
MNDKRKSIYAGFTLIETLIYMGIIGAILGTFMSFGGSLSSLRNKTYVMAEVQSSSRFAMDVIKDKIRQAKSVDIPAKGQQAEILSLLMPDSSTVTFGTSTLTGRLEMTAGADEPIAIVSEQIIFPALTFTNLGTDNTKDSIMIDMTAKYKNENGSVDFNYSGDLRTTVDVKDRL